MGVIKTIEVENFFSYGEFIKLLFKEEHNSAEFDILLKGNEIGKAYTHEGGVIFKTEDMRILEDSIFRIKQDKQISNLEMYETLIEIYECEYTDDGYDTKTYRWKCIEDIKREKTHKILLLVGGELYEVYRRE